MRAVREMFPVPPSPLVILPVVFAPWQVNDRVVERPQHVLMRVAVGIHQNDIEAAVRSYHLMSQRWFTHASPTLFNAGTPKPQVGDLPNQARTSSQMQPLAQPLLGVTSLWWQSSLVTVCRVCWPCMCARVVSCWAAVLCVTELDGVRSWCPSSPHVCFSLLVSPPPSPLLARVQLSSCFLVCMKDDSIEGIYDTLKECAVISKSAGEIKRQFGREEGKSAGWRFRSGGKPERAVRNSGSLWRLCRLMPMLGSRMVFLVNPERINTCLCDSHSCSKVGIALEPTLEHCPPMHHSCPIFNTRVPPCGRDGTTR